MAIQKKIALNIAPKTFLTSFLPCRRRRGCLRFLITAAKGTIISGD